MNSKKTKTIKSNLKQSEVPGLDLRQEEGFSVAYANHITVVPTGYDLKITFGRIDPAAGPNVVLQNRAIVISWPTVKTILYLLRVQLAAYEEGNGHVPFPEGGITPPSRYLPAEIANLPRAKRAHEEVMKAWDDFLAANPEAMPEK